MSDEYFDGPEGASTASDFFEGGSPSCRFNNVGDTHTGTIVKIENAQQRDIKTGNLKFWPDGNKAEMLIVTLQTNERDPEIDDDDGQRRLYVNKPSGMFVAIKAAVAKRGFAVGGTLSVRYTKNGKPTQPGFSPPKEYAATYTPPSNGAPPKQFQPSNEMKSAFKAFAARTVQMDAEGRKSAWNTALKQHFGDAVEPKELIPADWIRFEHIVKEHWTEATGVPIGLRKKAKTDAPFTDDMEAAFQEADIPF